MHILRAKRAERAESFLPPFLPLNARCTDKSKLSKAPREAAVAQSFFSRVQRDFGELDFLLVRP